MSEKVKVKLVYPDGTDYIYWTFPGVNLWKSLAAHGIDVVGSCSGKGTCGKCKVRIEGTIEKPGENELRYLLPEEIKVGERLACYCIVESPLTVYLDYGDFGSDAKSKVFKEIKQYQLEPRFQMRKFFIPGLDKEEPIPLQRRLKRALPGLNINLNSNNWNQLANLDRAGRPALELCCLVFEQKQVKYIGRERKSVYGIALDIGSTSLFAVLIDLTNGKVAAMASKTNMQRVYGADVISRISYSLENDDGLFKLNKVLLNSINTLVEEMLQDADVDIAELYEYAIVGNPVMLHFLLNINPSGFAVAPYSGIVVDELEVEAQELGLMCHADTGVYILPQVGGFIGADIIAGLLTLNAVKKGIYLFIDIGTNGEIVLFKNGQLWTAAAAAGPAFEGGGISCGARAGIGIIDRVDINSEGELSFQIPGEKMARGICGSAIIDLVAAMLEMGYIDKKGIITTEATNKLPHRESERGIELVLLGGESNSPLVINQEDIRQVQLAKAAIRTAIDIILKQAGVNYNQLQKIYIAGVFGSYISPDNAMLIKLLPPVERNIIVNLGNAAAQGAMLALLSESKRREARLLQSKIELVELNQHPAFQEVFINNLNF